MFDSAIVETAIGLALVFALVALLTTALQELISSGFHTRAKFLRDGICNMVETEFTTLIYQHPLIASVQRYGVTPGLRDANSAMNAIEINDIKYVAKVSDLPSYLPSVMFASVLLDVVRIKAGVDSSDPRTLAALERAVRESVNTMKAIKPKTTIMKVIRGKMAKTATQQIADPDPVKLSESQIGEILLLLIARAERRVSISGGEAELLTEVAAWYDAGMERISGWYKRQTQVTIFCIGFFVAVTLNIDAIRIADRLHSDPDLRQRTANAAQLISASRVVPAAQSPGALPLTVAAAQDVELKKATTAAIAAVTQLTQTTRSTGIPLGWEGYSFHLPTWVLFKDGVPRLFGWLIVAVACTIGAPFWFDLLQRFITIRGAGSRPAPSTDAGRRDTAAGDSSALSSDIVAASGPPLR